MTEIVGDFQSCCVGLLSPKVTVRSKNADKLSQYLSNKNLLEAIDDGDLFSWDSAVYYVNAFLIKEAEKLFEDEQKKTVSASVVFKRAVHGDLLLEVVKLANRNAIRLQASKLIECVETCFQSRCMSKHFSKTYTFLLRDRILSEKLYWGQLSPEDWLRLYEILKQLIKKPVNETDRIYYIESLHLLIKWGPLHSFPVAYLRNEFDVIGELCSNLSEREKTIHEKILQLLIEFYKHTAKDCRMACCKFGETTFGSVRALYSVNSLDRVKLLLFEYFLLQVKLHHPRGAVEGSSLALAISWHTWLKHLKSLYQILCHEVDKFLCTRTKNYTLIVVQNEHKTVHRTFIRLIVEVYRQMLAVKSTSAISFADESFISDESESKRRRIEGDCVDNIIERVRAKRDWPWINILTHILKRYPQLIKSGEFTKLLQLLSEVQVESKDADMRYHLYECLIVLADVQKHISSIFMDVATVESLWSVIWESTLRAVGLNQNESQTNLLLQKLITLNHTLRQSSEVFRAYFSGVLRISKHSLSTLKVACTFCPFPENTPQFPSHEVEPSKLTLLKLLLSKENCGGVFSDEILAEVCVSLILKTFPKCSQRVQEKDGGDDYGDIEKVYKMTCVDGGLLVKKVQTKKESRALNSHIVDKQLLEELIVLLVNIQEDAFAKENSDSPVFKLITCVLLSFNMLSYLLRFDVVQMEELADFILYKNVLEMLDVVVQPIDSLCAKMGKTAGSSQITELKGYLQLFEKLFQINILPEFSYKFREVVPVVLLRPLFDLEKVESREESDCTEVKILAAKVISQYCCVPGMKKMCKYQRLALDALIPDDFDANLKSHYDLAVIYLAFLKDYECGTLTQKLIVRSLVVIENILAVRYTCYETLLMVLRVLRDLYPHIVLIDTDNLRQKSVDLLKALYEIRSDLSAEVTTALIDCMGVLTKLDEEFSWAKWNNKHVSEGILEFISSNYQEVRLTAVQNLAFVFQKSSSIAGQQNIFEKLNEKCDDVFKIENVGSVDLSEERKIDETVTRTASVMHTYGIIMAISGIWRRKALLALLQILYKRKLDVDTFRKTLKEVAGYLGFSNTFEFLKNYLSFLLEDWYKMTGSLDEFPFSILDCTSEREFCLLVLHFIVPLLAQEENVESLTRIASVIGISTKELVERCFAETMSKCFLSFTKPPILSNQDLENVKRIHRNLVDLLGSEAINRHLQDKIDEIIVGLIKFVYDPDYFKNVLFGVDVVLLEPNSTHYSLETMHSCFECLQEKFLDGKSLMPYCIEKYPAFIQKILLNLTVDIYSATVLEEKMISFCHYTILLNEILQFLKTENPMQVFLVNYVICSLVNLINNEKETFSELAVAACKHLKQNFQNILSDCAELIEKLLVRIVSTLVPIARSVTKLGETSMDLLNFLIVDNAYVLVRAVELLDPFPEEPLFEKLSNVHYKIKYGKQKLTLEQEIRQFLNTGKETGSYGCRAEGLVYLKKHLADRKDELKTMYVQLSEMRGFAEDAQGSLLHQLICVLVKLTRSEKAEVRLEAVRCLGEIGPADLTTLVLQTDLGTLDFKYTHFELVTGRILGVFVQYIVDPDVEVVRATSAALYRVLQSKEGKSIIASRRDYGSGVIDKNLLLPFTTSVRSTSASQIHIEEQNFINRVNSQSLWCPQSGYNHSEWIKNLVCAILETISDSCYLPSLIPVCKAKVQFSELLLPLLINLLLYTSNKTCIQIICRQVNYFFERHWSLTTQNEDNFSLLIPLTQTSVQCMLDVVHFYRIQRSQIAAKKSSTGLEVNYLHVARAAQFCFAYFSVLLYIELWAREQLERIRDVRGYQPFATDVTELDVIYQEQDEHTRNTLHTMLKNAYTAIGEIDALHGCSLSQFFSNDYCKDLGSLELLQYYDMQISHGATSSIPNLMDSLKNCSLYQLPLICKAETNDFQYECLWRLGQWNEKVPNAEFEDMHNSYEQLRYFALKALHDRDEVVYLKALQNARRCVIEDLKCSSLESCKNLYSPLCKLQSLQELEDFGSVSIDDAIQVVNKWKMQDTISNNEFFYMEPIKAQRIAILKSFLSSNNKEDLKACLIDSYLELAVTGRQEGSFNISRRALGDLRYLADITQENKLKVVFEEAQLNWASGNKHIGKQMLRQLLNTDIEDPRLNASALKLYGTWMADASCQSSQVIIQDYLLKSIKVSGESNSDVHDAYIILAKFADREYQHVLAYTKSTGFQRTIQNVERSKQKADDIRKKQNLNEDERKAHITLEKQSRLDEGKITSTYREKDTFLHLAVKYYLRNLEASDLNNMSVFRVISLYLENRTNTDLKSLMQGHLPRIPSHKYVTILPQLVPHITTKSDDVFGSLITSVVLRCAKEHPHHTLPLILALINGDKDRFYSNSTTQTDTNETRLSGAKLLIRKLKEDARMAELVDNMMQVADALIQLAYVKTESRERKDYEIQRTWKLRQLKNIENVLVPTVTLPVSKSGNYDNIIGIRAFTDKYGVADGVNAPKRLSCQGTDGLWRMQLVKGKDDLRQDAVMQQVFTIMNTFLMSNKQTKRLLIRTYKIVPLSMRSGILEWVENSMPIGEYLVAEGNGGAHALYSKSSQYSSSVCRRKIKDVAKLPNEEKLRVFMDICKKFPPVFHKFFETSFPQPTVWYERRRAYMHSVATSSMCCYILGIGDRHVRNILIDKQTAEVVHIDFGIAFDQGHILPTPETVPFRLTRDIEDGMGVSGIEGVFRRSCEKTMEVLRQNSQTIITILEVLLYDPLYSWAVTPAEAYNRQQEEVDGNVSTVQYTEEGADAVPSNISAERALLRLKEKLQGTEDGSATSVEGQVAKLIQQARNPENLCRLFNGWQAYL